MYKPESLGLMGSGGLRKILADTAFKIEGNNLFT